MTEIGVLIVEDELVAAEAHRTYIDRIPGFVVRGVEHDGAGALRRLAEPSSAVDLVLLDLHLLPGLNGLDVVRAMRAAGHRADVIAVTSARDLEVVRAAVSQGVVQYLLKPFTFAALRDKLERYAAYRGRLAGDVASGQHEVDGIFATLRGTDPTSLPKGMSRESLDAVVGVLRSSVDARSSAEVAAEVGASRVTARRYLEHLADAGLVVRRSRYGSAGRPEVEYRWVGGA
ncbi:MAG TPA: response regulator [Cellulomonadaceae bacterium]|nr:response regulator [Cellulomonadaceae bacterium]